MFGVISPPRDLLLSTTLLLRTAIMYANMLTRCTMAVGRGSHLLSRQPDFKAGKYTLLEKEEDSK